jgi:hypothetical protein
MWCRDECLMLGYLFMGRPINSILSMSHPMTDKFVH